jgi:hypothetical protein
MGWRAAVYFPAGVRDFSVLHSVQTETGARLASYPIGIVDSFAVGKLTGHEADLSPFFIVEVKNHEAIIAHPIHLHGIVVNQLIKHRGNFNAG